MTAFDPPRWLAGGTPRSAIVPARPARAVWRLISRHYDYAELCRATARTDPETASVLVAIAQAGIEWNIAAGASDDGQTEEVAAEVVSSSDHDELDAAAVAELLGCSSRNVGHLRASGRLNGRRVAGRWVYPPEAVAALAAQRHAG